MIKSISFLTVFLFFQLIYAIPAKIITETAVYEKNDFDADIITYLPANKKIQASKKIYKGKTFGGFRKVKLSKSTEAGKYGFVSDVDVKLLTYLKKQKKRLKKRLIQLKKKKLSSQYVYLNHYIGFGFSFNRFTEKNIEGENRSTPLTAITFQAIGPGSLLPRVPLNFSFSYAKLPPYYQNLNTDETKSASGYTLFGDISYPMIISDFNHLLIYWSLGASFRLLKGTLYKGRVSGADPYSKAIKKYYWGSLLSIGALWDFSQKLSARLDARYHYNGGVFFEGVQTTLLFKY